MGTLALVIALAAGARLALTAVAAVLQSGIRCNPAQTPRPEVMMRMLSCSGWVDTIPEPIYVKDAASRYIMVNEAFARALEVPAAKLVGHTFQDAAQRPDLAAMIAAEDAAIIKNGKGIFKEIRSTLADGTELRYLHVHKRYSTDASGAGPSSSVRTMM